MRPLLGRFGLKGSVLATAVVAFVGSVSAAEAANLDRKLASADTASESQPANAEAAGEPTAPKKIPSSNPLSGDPEAIELGTKMYFSWCVQCHGRKANGESRFGKYAGDLTKFWRGYKEFVIIVKNGRTGTLGMMPPWKTVLDDENIARIGAYLETLAVQGANWK